MPQNRDPIRWAGRGLVLTALIMAAACGEDPASSAHSSGTDAPVPAVDAEPPPPADEAASLPEFHGAYWLSEREWVRLPGGEENRVVVPGDVRLLVFDPAIASGFGSMVRGPVRHRFLRFAVDAPSPNALRTGSGGRRVFRSDRWETGTFVEIRTRPVEGQPAMLEVIPAEPLPPGRYRWDVSRPRVWLEVRGETDDAATFDKFKESYFPPAELDAVLADLEREADEAADEEQWMQRALRLRLVLAYRPDDPELKFEIALAQARAARALGNSARAADLYREAIEHAPRERATVEKEMEGVLDGERLDKFFEEAIKRWDDGPAVVTDTYPNAPPDVQALPGYPERVRQELRGAVERNSRWIQTNRIYPAVLDGLVATYAAACEVHAGDTVGLAELHGMGATQANRLLDVFEERIGGRGVAREAPEYARAAIHLGGSEPAVGTRVVAVVHEFASGYLERNPEVRTYLSGGQDQPLALVLAALEVDTDLPVKPEHHEVLRRAAERTAYYWRKNHMFQEPERAAEWEERAQGWR